MKPTNASHVPSREELQHWESRAPGWQIRCRKCGFTEPFGKYGIRLAGVGTQYTIGFCSRCRWLRIQVIEKRKDASGAGAHNEEPGQFHGRL
jgi:hypothetical protein